VVYIVTVYYSTFILILSSYGYVPFVRHLSITFLHRESVISLILNRRILKFLNCTACLQTSHVPSVYILMYKQFVINCLSPPLDRAILATQVQTILVASCLQTNPTENFYKIRQKQTRQNCHYFWCRPATLFYYLVTNVRFKN
jgi:hypothetical protein